MIAFGYTRDQTRAQFAAWYRGIGADEAMIERLWQDLQQWRSEMHALHERERSGSGDSVLESTGVEGGTDAGG